MLTLHTMEGQSGPKQILIIFQKLRKYKNNFVIGKTNVLLQYNYNYISLLVGCACLGIHFREHLNKL